jgi:hypothetical protein
MRQIDLLSRRSEAYAERSANVPARVRLSAFCGVEVVLFISRQVLYRGCVSNDHWPADTLESQLDDGNGDRDASHLTNAEKYRQHHGSAT